MSELTGKLDETIAAAVQAQISAQVLEALSGGQLFQKYVTAVLQSVVEVPDPKGGYGRTVKVTFVDNAIAGVIKKAVQEAVQNAVAEERERIQEEVRLAVKRRAADFAVVLTDELLKSAEDKWRFNVQLYAPKRES